MRLTLPTAGRFTRSLAVVAAALAVAATGTTATAAQAEEAASAPQAATIDTEITLADGATAQNVEGQWLVELSSAPVADGGTQAQVDAEQGELAADIDAAGIDAQITETYGQLWNGVTVQAEDTATLQAIAEMDNVVSIKPVIAVSDPDASVIDTAEADEATASISATNVHAMTGADVTTSSLGLTGKGVKVGIIDTGVDYDHPALGGTGTPGTQADGSHAFPNAKVVAGYDFVGDDFGSTSWTPKPDSYPDDKRGHGTHVAGIVTATSTNANGTATGVAPGTTIGAYRIFGTSGTTSTSVIISALERAYDDGMDIVNLSIGTEFEPFTDYPTTVAVDNLVDRGVIVVAAQGNEGTKGRWTMSAPGASNKAITAGSVNAGVHDTGLVSSFSSWGLNSDLSLKPDVVTPGGTITSTYPIDGRVAYMSMSGTSMATPYASGAIALLLQAHPEIAALTDASAAQAVRALIQGTADPVAWTQDSSVLEPLAHQGAGLIDVDGAATTAVTASPSALNLGDSTDGPSTQTLTLSNAGTTAVTYTLSHADAVTVTGPSTTPTRGTTAPATVSTDGTTVTVPARGTAQLTVTITEPAGVTNGDFYGGWLQLTAGTEVLRVPFSGVGGTIGGSQAIDPATSYLIDADRKAVPAGYVYGKSGAVTTGLYSDSVTAVIYPLVPVTAVVLEVTPVAADGTRSSLDSTSLGDHLGQGHDASAIDGAVPAMVSETAMHVSPGEGRYLYWDGSYTSASGTTAQAPAGSYRLTARMLPVGADGKEVSDWAVADLGTATISWDTEGYLPQSALTITADGATAPALVDDNVFSARATQGTASYVIDLGSAQDVTRVAYVPSQDPAGSHYKAASWSVETSLDGIAWTSAHSATIAADGSTVPATATLAKVVSARYVRVTLAAATSDDKVRASELRVATAATDAAAGVNQPKPTQRFSDVPTSHTFYAAIEWMASTGVTTGYADGTYVPSGTVTRDAMAAFLYRAAGSPAYTAPAASPFTDVPTTQPFYKEITWLAASGISTGWTTDSGAQYRPAEKITRDAMAAFLYRALHASSTGSSVAFTDVPASHPFAAQIAWMASSGISKGWTTDSGAQYRPGDAITRDAMAAFLERAYDK